mmetsp:Transcript_14604/g.35538  ORF Transcript_14604/g.35538 Transcript_14604/m.35538 type:complete len:1188 (+) Transcript_14604:120-3683(+)
MLPGGGNSRLSPSSTAATTSAYRSARSVRTKRRASTHNHPYNDNTSAMKWTTTKLVLVLAGTFIMFMMTIVPMLLLEEEEEKSSVMNNSGVGGAGGVVEGGGDGSTRSGSDHHHSIHSVVSYSNQVKEGLAKAAADADPSSSSDGKNNDHNLRGGNAGATAADADNKTEDSAAAGDSHSHPEFEDRKPILATKQQLARGVAGLPMSQTPALVGASPGHIDCDTEDVDDMAYWNDPQGTLDQNFQSPFGKPDDDDPSKTRYITFQPDPGGWNNIRMSMEIIFVFAATTGRTLVLPPKAPFYLLGTGKENARSFGSFYNLQHPAFKKQVKVITMSEFLNREKDGVLKLQDDVTKLQQLTPIADVCVYKQDSDIHCKYLFEHLRTVGYQPRLNANHYCYIFDEDVFRHGGEPSDEVKKKVDRFCGQQGQGDGPRKVVYYDQTTHDPQLIHWDASGADRSSFRLLNHFYSFMLFTDQAVDNHYKRFVRDFLHYKDSLYCSAGKVVHALNEEGKEWSTLHVRRGDLQYKAVKISAMEWYENLKEIWNPGEVLYIATDERNKTFFDPIKEYHELRFLDDYWDTASLDDLDPYFLGMVDTIVASHGRTFSGTWFSTFSGYINRMRGYLGYSIKDSWYGWLERKDAVREYKYPVGNYGAREWPVGWIGIDGDTLIEHELVPVDQQGETHKSPSSARAVQTHKLKNSIKLSDMKTDEGFRRKPLARALAGRSLPETPALDGAARGSIECDVNVDSLAYWNDPQGTMDREFITPFHTTGDEKYISFAVDRGGWNNVRMSMEIIFVIAAATGRTLVLPPKEPLYRLAADKDNKQRGFADFFPLDTPEFAKRIKTITTAQFIKREGGPGGRFPVPKEMQKNVTNSAEVCDKRAKSRSYCGHIADYLNNAFVPPARAQDYCIIFDEDLYAGRPKTDAIEESISNFCGERKRYVWTSELNDEVLIHFRAGDKAWRLLAHFYNMIHFTDPKLSNYFKRFVRDFLHYNDKIYCAAGKIVKALQVEGKQHGFEVDSEGGGAFSAMHVRRGDFQYKKVKISAEQWLANTKEVWKPNEIIYLATDERNKTFFDPIADAGYTIRFLDDYWDLAGLGDLDPNYFGMIDTIISSRGRAFAGTWFSTFTGYINRMRGYHGMSMMDSWYSFLERKTALHSWDNVNEFKYAYEWPEGWIGIDADVLPDHDRF